MTNAQRDYADWLIRYNESKKQPRQMSAAMVIPADARAMSATTALRRGYNGKKPRTRTVALTDCIVTQADGSQYIYGQKKNTLTKSTYVAPLINTLAPIGDSNH